MPKEIIHDNRRLGEEAKAFSYAVSPDNSTPLAIHVGWQKDLDSVQLASINLQEDGELMYRRMSDGKPPVEVTPGWFVDLDRAMINQLIRVLRRARDQAFGADE